MPVTRSRWSTATPAPLGILCRPGTLSCDSRCQLVVHTVVAVLLVSTALCVTWASWDPARDAGRMTPLPSATGPIAAATVAVVGVVAVFSLAGFGVSGPPASGLAPQGAASAPAHDTPATVLGRGERLVGVPLPGSTATKADGTPGGVTARYPRWRWPIQPRPPVLRPFRAPVTTYGAGHRGLDLGADPGEPVRAVEAGVVTHAGVVAGRGTVTVTHADGLRSTYEPVGGEVSVGEQVHVGDGLGVLQPGGRTAARARACISARVTGPATSIRCRCSSPEDWRCSRCRGLGERKFAPADPSCPLAARLRSFARGRSSLAGRRRCPSVQARGCACAYDRFNRSTDTWV